VKEAPKRATRERTNFSNKMKNNQARYSQSYNNLHPPRIITNNNVPMRDRERSYGLDQVSSLQTLEGGGSLPCRKRICLARVEEVRE
jgi:hypothetical protein